MKREHFKSTTTGTSLTFLANRFLCLYPFLLSSFSWLFWLTTFVMIYRLMILAWSSWLLGHFLHIFSSIHLSTKVERYLFFLWWYSHLWCWWSFPLCKQARVIWDLYGENWLRNWVSTVFCWESIHILKISFCFSSHWQRLHFHFLSSQSLVDTVFRRLDVSIFLLVTWHNSSVDVCRSMSSPEFVICVMFL